MRLHKTGHVIADTVSDLIGEVPDGEYNAVYGILRHELGAQDRPCFIFDRAFWGANHYDGLYRLALNGTQPLWHENGPSNPHGLTLEPWRKGQWTMICPPTDHVCKFFGVDYQGWLYQACEDAKRVGLPFMLRTKEAVTPIEWESLGQVITFNSSVGVEALRRGISVISDPEFSTIGSYTKEKGIDGIDRNEILSFCAGHQFKLSDKETICNLIRHYIVRSAEFPNTIHIN